MDVVIPIVFPDYKITVEVSRTEVDLFPWTDFDNFAIPGYKDKYSNLGHAGVLIINGESGLTKYYEYGRYDRAGLGLVRRIRIPNVQIKNKAIDLASLKNPMKKIARVAGQSGRIEGVYIEVENKFDKMYKIAERRKQENGNPKRRPYNIISNSCIHFAKEITAIAGVDTPWMIDPRPNSYIGEFRDDYPDLDYSKNILTIEGKGKF